MADNRFAVPKLNGQNWQTWRIRVEMLLSREDLWYVVKDPVPEEECDRDEDWCSDDRKAKATIVLLLDDSQLPLVKNKTYARDVFEALKCYHQKTSRSIRVSLLKRLCAINLVENGDLEQHLTAVDDLFDRLEAAGTKLDSETKVCMLLRSLPPSFDGIVAVLDSIEKISLDSVKARLMDEYQRRRERDGRPVKPEKAMRTEMRPSGSKQTKETRTCFFCKLPGHIRQNCRKYIAFQKEEAAKKERAKTAHSESKSVAFTVGSEFSSWIIDSGASAHMTSDESFFSALTKYEVGWITLADGKLCQILGQGSGVLFGVDGKEEPVKIEMGEVQFVPGLASSLISVSQLSRKGLSVTFGKDDCKILDQSGNVVVTGVRSNGLYLLRQDATSMNATVGQHNELCQHQWHRRLGHRDWQAVERLLKDDMATGIKVSKCNLKIVCECCAEGKSARAPFPAVEERKSNQVLDIIHTDLCGPMKETTPSGNRYVMHLIDDFSRFTVTYLLKNKSEAADNIKDFVRWAENIFGRKPRAIRSDGGGEFDNSELRRFYKQEGIVPQFTTPYSPQSNGVAERKNRSITEMATCMLLDAGLEKRYWGEAVLTATYLQNRLPSRSIQCTPYELWWGRKPDLSHLRVFGSEAFVHVPSVKRAKLDSKARKLTLVGYSMEHKAYRFVDRTTDQITVSRDARFVELGNGSSSSVEFPVVPEEKRRAAVEEVKIQPFKEDGEEPVGAKPPENEEDPLGSPGGSGLDASEISVYESLSDDEESPEEPVPVRPKRSNRGVLPSYLRDYEVDVAAGSAECVQEEPNSVEEAKKKKVWRDAMDDELESHRRNGTWELVPLPKGRKVIGSKWVFKVKKNEQGQVVKCKARIVAQGYAQKYGVDFDQVYAPVTQQATFRTFLAVAAKKKLAVKHIDVKTAYLNAELEEEVYMRQPPGYAAPNQEELVCRLKRSIYGLRQSARCWNKKLEDVLGRLGFQQSTADQCLFIKKVRGTTIFLLVYVDDILVASSDEAEIQRVIDALNGEFELTSLGDVSHFLGMEVRREEGAFKLRLLSYIDQLIDRFGMSQAKPAKSPMDPGYAKTADTSADLENPTLYRSLVGGLLYLSVCARPDIAASAAILGRKFAKPSERDWTAAKGVLRYLKGTREYYLHLSADENSVLSGYCDSDWADDVETRRSTSGFVFMFGNGAIVWASRRQACVTLSSMEAEYVALCEGCQDAIWLRHLLCDLDEEQTRPTIMREDNQSCLTFVKTGRSSRRSKHIDTKERFVEELCSSGQLALEYCPTDVMAADVLTKPLGPAKLERFRDMLGVSP